MKYSKNFNVRSTGFDYTKQRAAYQPERAIHTTDQNYQNDEKENFKEEIIYVKRPINKKTNRFQK